MSRPVHSVLISSRDEGAHLRRTVDGLLEDATTQPVEIVVVDDASTDGSADFLENGSYAARGVRLHRNATRQGVAGSRAIAADLARGEYLCVLDAHSRGDPGWLDRLAEALAGIDDRGLVVPAVAVLENEGWEIDAEKPLALGCTIKDPFLDFVWAPPRTVEGHTCACTIGGGAWMSSSEWYAHVGGLDRGMRAWGCENIDLPIRTWIAGGLCLVDEKTRVAHVFKKGDWRRPNASGPELTYNKIRLAHAIFEKSTFLKVLDNLRSLRGFEEAVDRAREDGEKVGSLKGHLESIRQRTDRWLLETFELPVLETPRFFAYSKRYAHKEIVPKRRHPTVTVVATGSGPGRALEPLARSVLDATTYSRYRLLLACSGASREDMRFTEDAAFQDTTRLEVLQTTASLGGGTLHDLAAIHADSDYLIFLDETVVDVEPHWIEELVLLFERRPLLLMAAPRTRLVDGDDAEDAFDVQWDWSRPTWQRRRTASPLLEEPYQAFGVPTSCFMVHRERFLELDGFDRTVVQGDAPVMDLAIHGWLAGYEVACHPGVTVTCRRPQTASRASDPESAEYAQVLPVVKYFSDERRRARCLELRPRAEPLLSKHRFFLDRRRRGFGEYARFDEDWLFYKFGIEGNPE